MSYVVVEEGAWNIDGVWVEAQKYTSTVTADNDNWIAEKQTYLQSTYSWPVVFGQVMSENDPRWSTFWSRGVIREKVPSDKKLSTGKHVGQDPVVARADETIGIIVFDSGHRMINGVELEAHVGSDTVLGVHDNPPYVYTVNVPFATAPQVAIVTQAGVDGADGGWAQTHGSPMTTANSVSLSIDEDQLADNERSHTSEQVSWILFETPVVYPPAAECATDADCDDGVFCNGVEACDAAGICQPGTPPCNGPSCDEATQACGCLSDASCDDGVPCTVDSCNRQTGECENVANDGICDDGVFCNGVETCDGALGCTAGVEPCPGSKCDECEQMCVTCQSDADCDDGVACTTDICATASGSCQNFADDSVCDDGRFCNGAEACNAVTGCEPGTPPCPAGQSCDDTTGSCQ